MAQKKAKRYVITFDSDGEEVVWMVHADLTMTRTALNYVDVKDSDIPINDLRWE
jgi:hypothetical protein